MRKDSWRSGHEKIALKHGVGGDIMQGTRRTKYHGSEDSERLARAHYHVVFAEVCRPLTDFGSFEELARLMADAMIGMFACVL